MRTYPPLSQPRFSGLPWWAAVGFWCAFCCVMDPLPGHCLRRTPVQIPLSLLFLELSGYYVNAVRLHVYAADVLVRHGVDREGSRYPPICATVGLMPIRAWIMHIWVFGAAAFTARESCGPLSRPAARIMSRSGWPTA